MSAIVAAKSFVANESFVYPDVNGVDCFYRKNITRVAATDAVFVAVPQLFDAIGSASLSTEIATNETFTGEYVLDFGHIVVAFISVTLVSTDEDGELFTPENLYVKAAAIESRSLDSFDPLLAVEFSPDLVAGGDEAAMTAFSSRYLKVTLEIRDADNDDAIYSGGNLPIAHLRIDAEYS